MGAARGRRGRRAPARAHRPGCRLAFREARRGARRQGDDRVHEPPHLHRPLSGTDPAPPGLAWRGGRRGSDQGRDDRGRLRSTRLAAAHPQQGAPRDVGQAVPRPGRSPSDGRGPGHVADRLRRAEPPRHVRGKADARPRADAGGRAGEPGVAGQTGRSDRGLPVPSPRKASSTFSPRPASRSPTCRSCRRSSWPKYGA